MSSHVNIIRPLNDSRWNSMVEAHPQSEIYHHSTWLKVIAATYRQAEPLAFVLEEGGAIRAALPACVVKSPLTGNRLVSLPFTSYCNPLYEKSEQCGRLIHAAMESLKGHGASFFELRTLNAIPEEVCELKRHPYHMTHILDLEGGFDRVRKGISSNIVMNKKKADKAGILVEPAASEKDLRDFYRVHAITRKKQGFPIQPYSFLRNMFELMGPPGHVEFLLARLNNQVVAGIVLFKFHQRVSYEIGASLPAFLEARPNHLLLWHAVESACREGRRYFDFGKSPPDNPGLIEFKRRWGADACECPYYYYPGIAGMMAVEQNDFKSRAIRYLYSRTPLGVAQLLGKGLYRHLG
ncbi:MAG: GNAT family N-acetyltransferase [Kiritimatiellia bacterium]